MGRNRGTGRFIRRCYRMLITVMALAVVTGLVVTGGPARAAVSVPSAALNHMARQSAGAMGVKKAMVATAPSGDVTISVDPGISYNTAAMQQLITQVQGENGHLSDSFKRMFSQVSASAVPGSAATQDFSTTTNWQNFDGTLAMTSDDTGLSVTIPAAEVQTSATFWQQVVSAVVGASTWMIVRVTCTVAMVLALGAPLTAVAKDICASLGAFMGTFVRGFMVQGFDGTLGSATAWAGTVVSALLLAVPPGIWEIGFNAFVENTLPGMVRSMGRWIRTQGVTFFSWLGTTFTNAMQTVGNWLEDLGNAIPGAARNASAPTSASGQSCDIYEFYRTPCAAAHSTVRALSAYYNGPLYQVQRASDNATADIGVLSPGGYADASQQDSFCNGTSCTITKIYDQSYNWNDLTVEGAGGAAGADHAADAAALPVTVAGHKAYGIDFTGQIGYRDNTTNGIATGGGAEGMYMVASGTNVNSGCCFDYGNAETNTRDNGNGHMDAVNFSTTCYFAPCTGGGPWVEADMENGLFQGGNGSNTANTGLVGNDFVTAMLKNDGQATYALAGGNAQSGGLSTWYNGSLPTIGGYKPMQQEGAIVLGTGGDNSNSGVGSFFEGVMTQGFPSDAADAAVQANIVSAGYAGKSGGSGTSGASPAGPSVVHDGYSSVYSVDSANGHLQESYLPAMGAPWSTQDLSAKYGTPPVMPGTQPVALTHCGYTSVYTVDASNGDLQESYLPAMGSPWTTQDLSAKYGTPRTNWTPAALVHAAGATGAAAACGFTSVYTVDTSNGHLQETYLPVIGDPWTSQDLSAKYGTPQVLAGTSPVAIVHCGYTSVYTVDPSHDLQETYLPAIGGAWTTQDLSAKYGTPKTSVTPTALVHASGATGAAASCGFTSVYTVDDGHSHLQETYLPLIGDPWTTQDLSANYGTPPVAPGTQPVALYHTGYSSVYTVDEASLHLQETYLAGIGAPWATQDFSAKYGAPTTSETPIALLHPDTSGNLTWSSVYTIDQFSLHLKETYLPAIGDAWTTQDLSAKYGTPPVAETPPATSGWSVDHDGYTSAYTVDKSNHHLQETYLPAIGDSWSTQDLSAKYGTPVVAGHSAPASLTHDGYTSVYTIDASNGDLQETYLPAMGNPWSTQDLSAQFGTPPAAANTTPTALFHDGYTSVYTVAASNGHLWETYLPALGGGWTSQDLTAKYGTPAVAAGTSPAAIMHSGWTSVYTVDTSGHVQETYLPAIGDPWTTQDLSAKYGTPATAVTPAVMVHDGFTSVYTVDTSGHLQETYLPAIGDPWTTQDLSAKYGTPSVEPNMAPVALDHTGYASVYTLDASNGDLEETYLPAISDAWAAQDLSAKYGTPVPNQPPSPLVHYDTSGGLTWTSLYTVDQSNDDLQETYLPAIGDSWTTQDLSAKYGTPPV